jgi:hypothetical protein
MSLSKLPFGGSQTSPISIAMPAQSPTKGVPLDPGKVARSRATRDVKSLVIVALGSAEDFAIGSRILQSGKVASLVCHFIDYPFSLGKNACADPNYRDAPRAPWVSKSD